MFTNKAMTSGALYTLLAFISACSSSNNSSVESAEAKFSYFGTISISDTAYDLPDITTLDVKMYFDEYVPAMTSNIHTLTAPTGLYGSIDKFPLDTCEIRDLYTPSADSEILTLLALEEFPTRFDVSAGTPILVKNGGDTIAEITEIRSFDSFTFPAGEYPSELDLSVDIPGNVFPTMNVEIPNVEKLVLGGSSYLPMNIGSSITWLPDSDSSTHVMIDMIGFSTEMPMDEQRIFCKVTDDGEFTLPTNIITHYAEAGIPVPEFTSGRMARVKIEIEERTTTSVLILRYSEVEL